MRSRDRLAMLDLDGAAPVILTREGKRLLTERARALRRLAWLVDHATVAEDLAGGPAVVDLGTAVTVRDAQGVMEQFLIVHPVEAPLDDVRISVRSPLAQALLGHRVGEEVQVAAPSGPYTCRIVAVEGPPVDPEAAPRTLNSVQGQRD